MCDLWWTKWHSFHRLLHIHHHLSSGACTIGQLVAEAYSVSLHPKKLKKKNCLWAILLRFQNLGLHSVTNWKGFGGKQSWRIWSTIPKFVWRGCQRARKFSVTIVGVSADIRASIPPPPLRHACTSRVLPLRELDRCAATWLHATVTCRNKEDIRRGLLSGDELLADRKTHQPQLSCRTVCAVMWHFSGRVWKEVETATCFYEIIALQLGQGYFWEGNSQHFMESKVSLPCS
jgi:hypothetical protein